jgi:isopentenyldiphosphate isomerase
VTDELVVLVDEHGSVVGSAPRSVVRRDNLRHAATAVLVRDPGGRIYLHRRTDNKDWAPGHWDAAAGGVIAEGETPRESAFRELAEELGIRADALTELGRHLFEDDTTRCFEHAYEVVWDGPVEHQPEEVAEGRWVTLDELAALLTNPAVAFVSDTRQLLGHLAADGVGDYATLAATPG